MKDPATHEIRVIAWQHNTWRLVLEDMLTGERQELDPLVAMADGSSLKLKYEAENWTRYPIWSPDDDS